MSKYFHSKFSGLQAYVPGEQPKEAEYIKLNTNESPFSPPEGVVDAAAMDAARLNLYNDPECTLLRKKAARLFGVSPRQVMAFNGSDEALFLAFMAYGEDGIVCPEFTYGFYKVYAQLHGAPLTEIAMEKDLSVSAEKYIHSGKMVVLANPNAQTGTLLSVSEIERVVSSNPDHVVLIDEAYIAFGGESAVPLTKKYNNLLVTRTFSKSHSLAGARLGFGIGSEEIISDLNRLKYSINPYNVNRMTQAAGCAAIDRNRYFEEKCSLIAEIRDCTAAELSKLGFSMTASRANFLYASNPAISGKALYLALKEKGILVRWFDHSGTENFIRITIGSGYQMDVFLDAVREILKENLR